MGSRELSLTTSYHSKKVFFDYDERISRGYDDGCVISGLTKKGFCGVWVSCLVYCLREVCMFVGF